MRIAVIDWETLGLNPRTAPLLSFGYVMGETARPTLPFAHTKHIIIPEKFNTENGRVASFHTINWWIGKSHETHELHDYITNVLERSQCASFPHFITNLERFCYELAKYEVEGLFCTDKSFDVAILLDVLSTLSIHFPIHYHNLFETRLHSTILSPESFSHPCDLIHHTAQDDATWLFHSIADMLNKTA